MTDAEMVLRAAEAAQDEAADALKGGLLPDDSYAAVTHICVALTTFIGVLDELIQQAKAAK